MVTPVKPRLDDIPRIAFVTQHFHELQGLTTAMLGGSLIVTSLTAQVMPPGYPAPLLQAWNSVLLPCTLMVIHLQRMYRQSFGDAVGTPRQQFASAMPMLAVIGGGMADVVGVAHSGPSLAGVALASCSLWIVARDWRWRLHHLVPAAAGIIAAMVTTGAPPVLSVTATDPVRTETYLLSFAILGLGMVAAGLLDHRLLVSSFVSRSTDGGRSHLALARADSGWMRAMIAGSVCMTYGGALWLLRGDAYFALWLGLFAALFLFQMGLALFQISRAVRRRAAAAAIPPVLRLHLRTDSLALMLGMALAAAIQSALDPEGVTLVAVAIGAASLWVAVRDWPHRGHYLIGAVAAIAAVTMSSGADQARSLSILIFSTSGALMLEGLLDHLVATRHHRIDGLSDHEAANADTI